MMRHVKHCDAEAKSNQQFVLPPALWVISVAETAWFAVVHQIDHHATKHQLIVEQQNTTVVVIHDDHVTARVDGDVCGQAELGVRLGILIQQLIDEWRGLRLTQHFTVRVDFADLNTLNLLKHTGSKC